MATQAPVTRSAPARSRAEIAADTISQLCRSVAPGARLGSRADLRELCGVSVGTLHEALRLLQSTGEIRVRTGPGGGIFAGQSSAFSDLVRSVQIESASGSDYPQIARVLQALHPLIVDDVMAEHDAATDRILRERLAQLADTHLVELRDVVRASLDVFATVVSIPSSGMLRVVAGSMLRAQVDTLESITGTIDPEWRDAVDEHVAAVSSLVAAIVAGDSSAAHTAIDRPEFMRLFENLAENGLG